MTPTTQPRRSSSRHAASLPLVAFALALSPHAAALAADDQVSEAFDAARSAIEQDDGLAPATRDAFDALLRALETERGTAAPPPDDALDRERTLLERLRIYGDLRLRHESAFDQPGRSDRHRQRVRFRLGANLELSPQWTLGARITTGDRQDPKSPHQTLGNGFDSFEVSFDRIFATYRPDWLPGAWVTGGKFAHPFAANPIYGELVWDADIQPEGIALGYSTSELGFLEDASFAAGAYNVLERGNASDAFAIVAQVRGRAAIAENWKAHAAVGYYHFNNSSSDRSDRIFERSFGNALLDTDGDTVADRFESDFGILNPLLWIEYTGWEMPLTVSAEYIYNTRADISEDQGWALGAALGRSRNQGDWQLYYQYQVVEQDAVFSPFTQDDFLLATNFRGHVFGAKYRPQNWLELHLWALIARADRDAPELGFDDYDRNQWRLRFDLNFSF